MKSPAQIIQEVLQQCRNSLQAKLTELGEEEGVIMKDLAQAMLVVQQALDNIQSNLAENKKTLAQLNESILVKYSVAITEMNKRNSEIDWQKKDCRSKFTSIVNLINNCQYRGHMSSIFSMLESAGFAEDDIPPDDETNTGTGTGATTSTNPLAARLEQERKIFKNLDRINARVQSAVTESVSRNPPSNDVKYNSELMLKDWLTSIKYPETKTQEVIMAHKETRAEQRMIAERKANDDELERDLMEKRRAPPPSRVSIKDADSKTETVALSGSRQKSTHTIDNTDIDSDNTLDPIEDVIETSVSKTQLRSITEATEATQ
jgi:hypothetical protein